MSLRAHMLAIVGDENTVGRYLFEKVGHTAFITIALSSVFAVPLFRASCAAVLIYLAISKTVVRMQYDDWSQFWRDGAFYQRLLYLTIVCALVVVLASADAYGGPVALCALGGWLVLFLLADNAWGAPR